MCGRTVHSEDPRSQLGFEQSQGVSVRYRNPKGIAGREKLNSLSSESVRKDLLTRLWSETRSIASAADIDVVGHRVVHGGPHFQHPIRISDDVCAAIGGLSQFAPLHTISELEV